MTENQRLKIFREFLGYKQKDFAKKLDMQPGSISDIERGKVGVSAKVKNQLKTVFLLNVDWLETGEGSLQIDTKSIDDKQGIPVSVFIRDYLKTADLAKISDDTGISLSLLNAYKQESDYPTTQEISRIIYYLKKNSNAGDFTNNNSEKSESSTHEDIIDLKDQIIIDLRDRLKEKDARLADKDKIIERTEESMFLWKEKALGYEKKISTGVGAMDTKMRGQPHVGRAGK